jgi:hypothetical protein
MDPHSFVNMDADADPDPHSPKTLQHCEGFVIQKWRKKEPAFINPNPKFSKTITKLPASG